MRLFVAAYPPPHVRVDIAKAVADLAIGRAAAAGVNVRLAPLDQLHVTLVFIGDVPDDREATVTEAITAAVAGWRTAPALTTPVLRLGGAGRFGRGQFTIVWSGLRGDVQALRDLSRSVRRRLKRARLPFDDKPFRPHLTIARPGDRVPAGDVLADLERLRQYQGPEWIVDEIRLVRSHLGPKPRYDYLASFPLGRK